MNYEEYHFTPWEFMYHMMFAFGLSAILAVLFYRSVWGMLLALVVVPMMLKRGRAQRKKRRKQQLALQFRDCIRLVAGALAAGYSVENAWRAAEPDLCRMYGEDADMCRELAAINARVRLNETIENPLMDFAGRSGLEDVSNFYYVFAFARKSGGNFVGIIENSTKQISDKQEIMQEIETVMASKCLEQKIMNAVPILLLAYVEFSSPEFLAPLFGNAFGVVVMSVCLLVYGIAFLVAEKITGIEV